MQPRYINAKYRGKWYEWYFSGRHWYCKRKDLSKPVGDGKTKDDAFRDLQRSLHHFISVNKKVSKDNNQ